MYQQILTAVDHVCSDSRAIQATQNLVKHQNVSVTLLHSIRKLPAFAFYLSLVSLNSLESRYSKSVKERLDYIAAIKDLPCNTHVDFGSIQSAVKKYCNHMKADLLVIEKGRAASALLQSPPCDMLVVNK